VSATRLVMKGHKLAQIYCYDMVSMKSRAVCECGWSGNFRSNFRARQAHREHKMSLPAKSRNKALRGGK